MMVKFRVAMAFSTASLASPRGQAMAGDLRNETKTNRSTLQLLAAFTRFNCPAASTDSMESPGWRDDVADAVEITASTPRQAAATESGSFRSPMHNSTPHDCRAAILSFELVLRTSALTFSPRRASFSQTALPTRPVAPITTTISVLPRTVKFYQDCARHRTGPIRDSIA